MAEKSEKTRSKWHPASILARIKKFFGDQKSEMKKIVWPSKKQVLNNTGIVLVVTAVFAVIVSLFDSSLSLLLKAVFGV
ncbi:MAG: preprotein translocase subunit SecE [Oscillospiraceae bacterium]